MKKLQREAVNLPGQTYECLLEIYRTPLCRELVISTVWKKLSQRLKDPSIFSSKILATWHSRYSPTSTNH